MVGVLVVASGCVSFNPLDLVYPKASGEKIVPGPRSDGKAVKERFTTILEDAASFLGGTWRPRGVGTPNWCGPVPGEDDGYMYIANWKRVEIVDDPKQITKLMIEHWKKQGYKVNTETWHDGTQVVRISAKSGDNYTFLNDEGELDLGGISLCYPGDWVEIRNAEYDEDERLHSTETPTPQPTP